MGMQICSQSFHCPWTYNTRSLRSLSVADALSELSVALRSGRGGSSSLNRYLEFGVGWAKAKWMRLVIAVGTLVSFLESEISLQSCPPFYAESIESTSAVLSASSRHRATLSCKSLLAEDGLEFDLENETLVEPLGHTALLSVGGGEGETGLVKAHFSGEAPMAMAFDTDEEGVLIWKLGEAFCNGQLTGPGITHSYMIILSLTKIARPGVFQVWQANIH
eukprot:scaffold25440_cov31-Attheya_sp.AAC.2